MQLLRGSAGLHETLIQGSDAVQLSAGASISGTAVTLDASGSDSPAAWALFSFDAGGEPLDSISVLMNVAAGSRAYIAVADFGRGAWEWHGPFSDSKTLAIDGGGFVSPLGVLHCVVAADPGSLLQVSALSIRSLSEANQNPVLVPQVSGNSGFAPFNIQIDLSASYDSDGQIIEYAFDWDGDEIYDGSTDLPVIQHVFSTPGVFEVGLRVTDDDFGRAKQTVQVSVNAVGNDPPTAGLWANPNFGDAPLQVTFGAGLSRDDDGQIVRVDYDLDNNGTWEIYDGPQTVSQLFSEAGEFTPRLRVTDNAGAQDIAIAELTIGTPLVARLEVPGPLVEAGATIALYGGQSGPDVVKYQWDLDGNGSYETNTGASAGVEKVFYQGGPKELGLQVTDINGVKATDRRTVNVRGWLAPQTLDSSSGEFSLRTVSGRPACAYSRFGQLNFIRAEDETGSSWGDPLLLDADIDSVAGISLLGDYPAAVSYCDEASHDLYVVCATTLGADDWSAPQLVAGAPVNAVRSALAEYNDGLGIVFRDTSADALSFVRGTRDGLDWDSPLQLDIGVGAGNSMALVDLGSIIGVAYHCDSELRYTRGTNADGSVWTTPVVIDAEASASHKISAAKAGQGPVVCYRPSSSGELRYARAMDVSGSAWNMPVVLMADGVSGASLSMIILSGKPAVLYSSSDPIVASNMIKALDSDGLTWGAAQPTYHSSAFAAQLTTANVGPAVCYLRSSSLRYSRYWP